MKKIREQLYTVGDIAELLGVTKYTVSKWLREGNLGGVKVGRLWRIRESDLDEFIGTTK